MPDLSTWSPGQVICLIFVVGLVLSGIATAIRGKKPHEVKRDDDDD